MIGYLKTDFRCDLEKTGTCTKLEEKYTHPNYLPIFLLLFIKKELKHRSCHTKLHKTGILQFNTSNSAVSC